MSVPNVSNVDWNLFLVLHTVLEEGSATKAAKRLSVTQSAVSNALARLRLALDDPLVVRIGNQLVPTPKARALAPRLRLVVAEISAVLEHERAFDPKSCSRRFVLAVSDDVELALLGQLLEEVTKHLPRASVRLVAVGSTEAANGLGTGEIDAVVGMMAAVPPGCAAEELFEDDLVVVVRHGHPFPRATIGASDISTNQRIGVQSSLDVETVLTRALSARGMSWPPESSVSSFVSAAVALEKTGAMLALPGRAADALSDLFALRKLRLEGAAEPLSISLVWHARSDADPAATYFRDRLRQAATTNVRERSVLSGGTVPKGRKKRS